MARYSVDMTWSGHVHLYHRTCPVYKNKCVGYHPDGTAKAPVHMIVGNAGFMSPLVDMYEQRPPWMDVEAFVSSDPQLLCSQRRLSQGVGMNCQAFNDFIWPVCCHVVLSSRQGCWPTRMWRGQLPGLMRAGMVAHPQPDAALLHGCRPMVAWRWRPTAHILPSR